MGGPAPRVFGRYVLLEQLGLDGGVEVDLARRVVDRGSFVRFVVLNRITADPALDPASVRRFKDELGVVSALQHPNLATLHDFGREGDAYFLAQEYAPGVDARWLIGAQRDRAKRVPLPVALKIAAEVLDALDHAHGRADPEGEPLLHLGLTARSVRLTARGEVKLVDLGLARAVALLQPTRPAHQPVADPRRGSDGSAGATTPPGEAGSPSGGPERTAARGKGSGGAATAPGGAGSPTGAPERTAARRKGSGGAATSPGEAGSPTGAPERSGARAKGWYASLAPEQLLSRPVDRRTDLYAAGLLLNELLTGLAPLGGLTHVQAVHRAMSGRLPELPPVPGLDDDTALRRIHDRALAGKAWERYPSAAAMAADLRQVARRVGGLATDEEVAELLASIDPELEARLAEQRAAYAAIAVPVAPAMAAIPARRSARRTSWASRDPGVVLDQLPPVVPSDRPARAVLATLLVGAQLQVLAWVVTALLAVRGEPGPVASSEVPSDHRPEPAAAVAEVPPSPGEPVDSMEIPAGIPPSERDARPGSRAEGEPGSAGEAADALAASDPVREPERVAAPEPLPAPELRLQRLLPRGRADFGRLTVEARAEGAEVRVDGAPVGVTALVRHKVPVGTHTVAVPGHTCTPDTVTIEKGEVQTVRCR